MYRLFASMLLKHIRKYCVSGPAKGGLATVVNNLPVTWALESAVSSYKVNALVTNSYAGSLNPVSDALLHASKNIDNAILWYSSTPAKAVMIRCSCSYTFLVPNCGASGPVSGALGTISSPSSSSRPSSVSFFSLPADAATSRCLILRASRK